jgi:hypothetical protein
MCSRGGSSGAAQTGSSSGTGLLAGRELLRAPACPHLEFARVTSNGRAFSAATRVSHRSRHRIKSCDTSDRTSVQIVERAAPGTPLKGSLRSILGPLRVRRKVNNRQTPIQACASENGAQAPSTGAPEPRGNKRPLPLPGPAPAAGARAPPATGSNRAGADRPRAAQ